jgi:hypothetical protein
MGLSAAQHLAAAESDTKNPTGRQGFSVLIDQDWLFLGGGFLHHVVGSWDVECFRSRFALGFLSASGVLVDVDALLSLIGHECFFVGLASGRRCRAPPNNLGL